MKTIQGKAIRAYKTIDRMRKQALKSTVARDLFLLRQALTPVYQFQADREKQLIEEVGGTINEKTGSVIITDDESRKRFFELMADLASMETDIIWDPKTIHVADLGEISVDDLESLTDYIMFE